MAKPKHSVAGLYEVQLAGPEGKTPSFVHLGGLGPQVPNGVPMTFMPDEMPVGTRIAILELGKLEKAPVPTVEETVPEPEPAIPLPPQPQGPPDYKVGDDVMVFIAPAQLETLIARGYPQPDYRDETMVAWKARVMPEAMTDHQDGALAIQLDKDRRNKQADASGKVALPQIIRMPLQFVGLIPEGHPLGGE